jgi:hypothetical protein
MFGGMGIVGPSGEHGLGSAPTIDSLIHPIDMGIGGGIPLHPAMTPVPSEAFPHQEGNKITITHVVDTDIWCQEESHRETMTSINDALAQTCVPLFASGSSHNFGYSSMIGNMCAAPLDEMLPGDSAETCQWVRVVVQVREM